MKHNKKQRGVTLVEIAIVLVIIGLLLGGILKGQELINNAKVRSIADRQSALKAAWFAFIDRYRALPGDYVQADQNVPGAGATKASATTDGLGFGDGVIIHGESAYVLQHLTGAGFLRCPVCTYAPAAYAITDPSAENSLQNQYGGLMAIFVDGADGAGLGLNSHGAEHDTYAFDSNSGDRNARLMVHTGQNIPSNIMAEVDRKIDDGNPQFGDLYASNYAEVGIAPSGRCMDLDGTNGGTQDDASDDYDDLTEKSAWRVASQQPEQNCGAAIVI